MMSTKRGSNAVLLIGRVSLTEGVVCHKTPPASATLRLPTMPAKPLSAGLTHEATYAVTPDMRPPHVAGILSTSRMIGLVEDTCLEVVQPLLDAGQTTGGARGGVPPVGTAWGGGGGAGGIPAAE